MSQFLYRYQQGECEQVWQELSALGSAVHSAEIYPDALAVAQETMRRVQVNIQQLIPHLEELGYEFGYERFRADRPHDSYFAEWIAEQPPLYTAPSPATAQQIAHFEQEEGPLPLALRAFYLEVGSVNFVGWHDQWERFFRRVPRAQGFDPLMVIDFGRALAEYPFWKAEDARAEGESPYMLPIAGDYMLKYNISGTGAYEMEFPNAAVDGPLLGEWHQTSFVNYLRICLHYGGLPGLESISHLIPEELAYLRKDLLPI